MPSRSQFLSLLRLTIFGIVLTIGIGRCGDPSEDAPVTPTPEAPPAVRAAMEAVTADARQDCRISDITAIVTPTLSPEAGSSRLWVRGGGGDASQVLSQFSKLKLRGKPIVIVLSATAANAFQSTFNYFQTKLPGIALEGVYTQSQADANRDNNAQAVGNAGAVIITGGYPDRLRHIPGTRLGEAIRAAHARGVPIYTDSASLSLIGNYFAWDVPKNINRTNRGIGAVPAVFLSHLDEPQKYGRSFLDDLWMVVPSRKALGFGLTGQTVGTVRGSVITAYGSNSAIHRIYVYDQRYLPTVNCERWYLVPGESFSLSTGKVTRVP